MGPVAAGASSTSSIATPVPSSPTEAVAHTGKAPLLPESVPPGLLVASVRRRPRALAEFYGGSQLPEDGDAEDEVCKICMLVVTETCLVHYTKRPKGAAAPKSLVAEETNNQSTSSASGTPTAEIDEKYWKRRYNYFSRFDEGIRMDPAGWFEVTPESVARHIADRMQYGLVVDGTCGVGGNAIQFALTSRRVIAVDTDVNRLEDAAHNASIYGVKDRIEFVCDDFANFASMYRGPQIDAVFLSPPWGGPAHLDAGHFSLKDVTCPDIVKLFAAGAAISQRVVLYLPRHADLNEMVLLASASGFGCCEVEKVFFEYPTRHLKLVVVYFSPEAISSPTPSVSKKKIGATGDSNRSHQKAKTSSALATISRRNLSALGLTANRRTHCSSSPLPFPLCWQICCGSCPGG